jgi:hypothetical protein
MTQVSSSCQLITEKVRALQRTNIKNFKKIFSEKELGGHSPNFHIHSCVCERFFLSVRLFFCYNILLQHVDPCQKFVPCLCAIFFLLTSSPASMPASDSQC